MQFVLLITVVSTTPTYKKKKKNTIAYTLTKGTQKKHKYNKKKKPQAPTFRQNEGVSNYKKIYNASYFFIL